MTYNRLYLLVLLVFTASTGLSQEDIKAKKLEATVARVVKKALPATVKIAAFDTLSQTLAVSRFSGVVVSADGLILTAAHATQPKQVYQICFPGGRKVLARGLGRISLGKDQPAVDAAMLQIMEKGKWPFTEMGYSTDMRKGQPCVGISFPGTFEQLQPNVRLGRIEDADISKGHFQSSSKMEPGDSGGALFDAQGRLIGIHSWILPNEQQNFEVPIDLYRKYWEALQVPISYENLPQVSIIKTHQPIVGGSIPPFEKLISVSIRHQEAVVSVNSILNGRNQYLLGTVIQWNKEGKKVQGILTKNSAIGKQAQVNLKGKQLVATPVYRDKENDLVLLLVNEKLPDAIDIEATERKEILPPGNLLFSILTGKEVKAGIVSTAKVDMLLKYSFGYFGAGAGFINDRVTITNIAQGSPAEGILQKCDQILAINGTMLSKPEQYASELGKYYPNDTLHIEADRGGKHLALSVKLGVYRSNMHTADAFPGGRSIRSDGFKNVIAQDAAIKASECGGPVFDSNEKFIGINISRHSRTATIIMPASAILDFLQES